MSIKLVALDMDGTLLDSNKKQPLDFMDWVKNHPNIKTVIASGRQYYTIVKDFAPISDKLIFAAENGGLVFENEKIIYKNEMLKEDICRCLKIIEKIDKTTPVACGVKSAYTITGADTRQEIKMYYDHLLPSQNLYQDIMKDTIVKLAVFVEGAMAEYALKYFTDIGENLEAVLSGDSWIDIVCKTANKGAAVAAIQHEYEIDSEESMAFGDYLNDVSLFKVCKESYCMENGHPDLKKQAKYIADTNDNDGVMKILRQL